MSTKISTDFKKLSVYFFYIVNIYIETSTEEKKNTLSHIYHPWYLQIENKIWIIIPMRKLHKIMWK